MAVDATALPLAASPLTTAIAVLFLSTFFFAGPAGLRLGTLLLMVLPMGSFAVSQFRRLAHALRNEIALRADRVLLQRNPAAQ